MEVNSQQHIKQTRHGSTPWANNLSTQEVDAEGSGIQGHTQLHSKYEANLEHITSCLKNNHMCTYTCTQIERLRQCKKIHPQVWTLKKIILLTLYHTKFIQITSIWSGKITARTGHPVTNLFTKSIIKAFFVCLSIFTLYYIIYFFLTSIRHKAKLISSLRTPNVGRNTSFLQKACTP